MSVPSYQYSEQDTRKVIHSLTGRQSPAGQLLRFCKQEPFCCMEQVVGGEKGNRWGNHALRFVTGSAIES